MSKLFIVNWYFLNDGFRYFLPKSIKNIIILIIIISRTTKKKYHLIKKSRVIKDVENFLPNDEWNFEIFSLLGYIETVAFGYIIFEIQTTFVNKILNSKFLQ